ncbi:hypothetical protein TNCV_3450481 [Trichonephila clavipes]|uniref:Uncharacterized protein n=1 Tax=Trichonephila clavipes TaxID=2585209 RepID=A0A8X7BM67_TRICX|nr:hypothetical protein TNCV_3450481 [Trichonephila clavipes]
MWSGAYHFYSPSTNLTRGLASRWLFKVPACHKGSIHLQTSMSSPRIEPKPNCAAVSTNCFTSVENQPFLVQHVKKRAFMQVVSYDCPVIDIL